MLLLALAAGCGEHLDTTFVDATPRDVLAPSDAGTVAPCATPRFPGWQRIAYTDIALTNGGYIPADLNADGNPETLVLDFNGTLSAIASIGDGTFTPPVTLASGIESADLTVGDFDGDSHIDVAFYGVDGVTVVRGNGDGTFGAPTVVFTPVPNTPTGTYIRAIHDGFLIATQTTIQIVRGQSDGTFVLTPSWALTPPDFDGIAVADFDRDQVDDIALLRTTNELEIYRLDGTLLGSQPYNSFAVQMLAGDIDGDGTSDVVITDGLTLSMFRGDGTGGLEAARTLTTEFTTPLLLADVDRDGTLDVVGLDSGHVTIMAIDGRGAPARTLAISPSIEAFAVADFDHDGVPDLSAMTNYGINVIHGNGDGTFATASATWVYTLDQGTFADLDGDGRKDAIYVSRYLSKVGISHARADGGFDPPIEYDDFSRFPVVVVAGDFDQDGYVDLVVEDSTVYGEFDPHYALAWWRGAGNGVFHIQPGLPISGGAYLRLADLDRDGRPELLTSTGAVFGVTNGTLAEISAPFTGAADMAAADLTGDRLPDFVAAFASGNTGGQISIRRGLGSGVYSSPTSIPLANVPYSFALADVDRDGITDIVVSTDTQLYVLRNRGNLSFTIDTYPLIGGRIFVHDVDGDGDLDLLVNDDLAALSLLLNNGDGTFAPRVLVSTFGTDNVDVRDVNGDGHPDLITIDERPGFITVTPQRCY
ncbi:MAG: VCBS repeat-containing protein [Kofleriaceae bacterium]